MGSEMAHIQKELLRIAHLVEELPVDAPRAVLSHTPVLTTAAQKATVPLALNFDYTWIDRWTTQP
jgi:hypothetical protein